MSFEDRSGIASFYNVDRSGMASFYNVDRSDNPVDVYDEGFSVYKQNADDENIFKSQPIEWSAKGYRERMRRERDKLVWERSKLGEIDPILVVFGIFIAAAILT